MGDKEPTSAGGPALERKLLATYDRAAQRASAASAAVDVLINLVARGD